VGKFPPSEYKLNRPYRSTIYQNFTIGIIYPMNIKEAREVLWLPNNRRLLGELMDEGYLTKSRLEWAAKKAFDPALKQAAQILLDTLNHSSASNYPANDQTIQHGLQVGISMEKARAIKWPFSPHKNKPMGELVETKQISLKDLGFAIENAWNKDVRMASVALLLVRLEQEVKEPEPQAGFVHVISGGRSYSKRQQYRLALFEGMMLGFMVFMALVAGIWLVVEANKPHSQATPIAEIISTPTGIAVIVFFFVLLGLIFFLTYILPNWISKQLDKKIEAYQLGEAGEEKTVQLTAQALDGNWTICRNLCLPGRNKGDLDIVLVGPPGVWVLEVKNFHGEWRNVGETWEYRQGRKWKPISASPSRQARNNAIRLGNFLKADHLKVFVEPAVVWANEDNPPIVENPSVPVWFYNRLPDELGNIWQYEKLSGTERENINEKFQKLCQVRTQKDNEKMG
jgi:hypothetical protein